MADTTYNGWTNYETWLVNLWMDNDCGEQEFFRGQAKEIYDDAKADDIWSRKEHARFQFADWLKDYWDEHRPELPGAYGDLLGGALGAVNWDEVARHYIDAVLEEVNDAEASA